MLWVGEFKFILFHFNCNIKGYKCSGIFCTDFHILSFLTFVMTPVIHGFFLFHSIFICKVFLDSPINAHLCYFSCIFRACGIFHLLPQGHPCPFTNDPVPDLVDLHMGR